MTATSPAEAIQTALYATLSADAILTVELGFAVVDDASNAAYPYVAIGAGTENPDNAHGEFGRTSTQVLDIWSDQPGFTQANRALARICELVDHHLLDLVGHRVVSCRFENAVRMRDPTEPFLRHIAATFRVVTVQTA
jgi:hypothetical protein